MRSMACRRSPRTLVDSAPPAARAAWSSRLTALARATGSRDLPQLSSPLGVDDLVRHIGSVVDLTDRAQVWLALATLSGVFPDDSEVVDTTRACELEGPAALWEQVARMTTATSSRYDVRVSLGATLVDVNHTVATDLATGIQRVARETVQRWLDGRGCVPVAWTDGFGALRELTALEASRLAPAIDPTSADTPRTVVVVPWLSRVVIPELAAEHDRSRRLLALARYSLNETGVIGFDCVPLTSAETTAEGFTSVFFGNLAAVRHFGRIATISHAALVEYQGWQRMLGAVGIAGPEIREIALPEEAPEATHEDLGEARQRFLIGDLPLVLVVGSHEPRKNHLAVLHAAELRWRAGDRFSLTFVGGNSWASEEFVRKLAELQRAGRPVESVSRLPDRLLWAVYRLARFSVFASLNEGFGLPVTESLAAGTPVVTSDYGSMREIAEQGGALLVDPRDDHAIAGAIGRLLRDDALLSRLEHEAARRVRRTWDEYADAVWTYLTGQQSDESVPTGAVTGT